ncbi:hypothetical protein STEG23_021800, partial [Scotinomys teguina]
MSRKTMVHRSAQRKTTKGEEREGQDCSSRRIREEKRMRTTCPKETPSTWTGPLLLATSVWLRISCCLQVPDLIAFDNELLYETVRTAALRTESRICQPPWFMDPGGWSKTAVVRLYFIFPGICTLSL